MPRVSGNIPVFSPVYLFCEGKTELFYFENVKRILRVSNFQVRVTSLGGAMMIKHHPDRVQKALLDQIERDGMTRVSKQAFIIFDLDIFENQSQLDRTFAGLRGLTPIVTNNTFEYWVLSHFTKYQLPHGKKRYLEAIRRYFRPRNPKFTAPNDFSWLTVSAMRGAIKNSRMVNMLSQNKPLLERDPYSNVYKIIESLEIRKNTLSLEESLL